MKNVKIWACGLVFGMIFSGTAFMIGAPNSTLAKAPEELKSHWRHHDGHWSYWSAEDNQWYYTDGTNWFYNRGEGAWAPYTFDKKFGREGFERGDYRVPGAGAKVVVPTHGVYRPGK
jgi:hypothetical protein